MRYYKLDNEYTLRADAHIDRYCLFNYVSGRDITITETDYILLNALSENSFNIEDLVKILKMNSPGIGATPSNVSEVIDYYLKNGFVKISENTESSPISIKRNRSEFSYPSGNLPVLSFPLELDIFLTKQCNLRCAHCSVDAGEHKQEELDLEFWKDIFDQLEENRVLKITLSGGEPCLYHNFWELVDYIKHKKIYKCLLSNGYALTGEAVKRLGEARFSIGLSLDGSNAETHDTFRGKKGSFRQVINTMENCLKYGLSFNILSVVHQKNIFQMEELFEIANRFHAIGIFFYMIERVGRGKNNIKWRLSPNESEYAGMEFSRIKDKFSNLSSSYSESQQYILNSERNKALPEDGTLVSCRAGTAIMAIDNNGLVYPCPYGVFLQKMPMGDSKKYPLKDIWMEKTWAVFRDGVPIEVLSECSQCQERGHCELKKCRMRSLVGGDILGAPYNCPMKKVTVTRLSA